MDKIPADGGLNFFGRITASISHELKNSLAVINELSGLMGDLLAMAAEKGRPPDAERFASLTCRIGDQVSRADGIIRRLNRFAHTVDEEVRMVDVGQAAMFLATLCGRFAEQRVVTVTVEEPEEALFIETSLFAFLLVGFLVLDHAMNQAGHCGKVNLAVRRGEDGEAEIRFSGTWSEPFCLAPEAALALDAWQGRLGILTPGLGAAPEVNIVWPARMLRL